jgi:hypothetical protein
MHAIKAVVKLLKMGRIDRALTRCRGYCSQRFAEGAIQCDTWKILDKQNCLMSLPTSFLPRISPAYR